MQSSLVTFHSSIFFFYHFKYFSIAHHKSLKMIVYVHSTYFSREPDDFDQGSKYHLKS